MRRLVALWVACPPKRLLSRVQFAVTCLGLRRLSQGRADQVKFPLQVAHDSSPSMSPATMAGLSTFVGGAFFWAGEDRYLTPQTSGPLSSDICHPSKPMLRRSGWSFPTLR